MTGKTRDNKELGFMEFIGLCWRYKWLVIAFTAICAVSSVYIALSIPNQYKSTVLLAPSEEQRGGGLSALANQFGSLASLAGINLGGKGGDKTLITLEVFRSKQFLMGFIDRHDLLVPLMAAKTWDVQTGELLINDKIYDSESQKWVRKVTFPQKVKPSLFEAYEILRNHLDIERDKKSGTVLVSLEYYSPVLAKQWLEFLVKDLNDYMREQESRESTKSIAYLNEQIATTEIAELKNVFFQLVQEQTKKAMLAQARDEFVFKTIDAAIVPETKSRPSRAILVLIITFFGGFFSIFMVHIRQVVLHKRQD